MLIGRAENAPVLISKTRTGKVAKMTLEEFLEALETGKLPTYNKRPKYVLICRTSDTVEFYFNISLRKAHAMRNEFRSMGFRVEIIQTDLLDKSFEKEIDDWYCVIDSYHIPEPSKKMEFQARKKEGTVHQKYLNRKNFKPRSYLPVSYREF